MNHRKELETTKVNYMVKFGSLENEVNQSISKNNVLKNKIKKIKKFMVSLCKLIEEQQQELNNQNKQKRGTDQQTHGGNGMDDDTDSDNEKLPTLELLCHKVKTLMTDLIEVKIQRFKRNSARKSIMRGPRSYAGDVESLFNGEKSQK